MNQKKFNFLGKIGPGITAVLFLLTLFSLVSPTLGETGLTLIFLLATGVSAGLVIWGLTGFTLDLNNWYEQILDHVYLPLSVTDLDMNWTFINKPVKNIIGVERADVMGHQCSEWNADICGTEKCGVAMLRKGLGTSFFTNEGVNHNFKVDTTYLYDRRNKDKKIGHMELVSDVTVKVRLDSAVDSLKGSSQNLASTIEQEAATTEELSATAVEFSQNLKSITANTSKQYAVIEESVSAIEEMAGSVRSVAWNTEKMAAKSGENVSEANRGRDVITGSLKGINVIGESLKTIDLQVQNLHEKTQRVDEILQVINNIADQTNLLSMNAAIEAAHAGEAGKGFSVVAEEIRKLAETSQQSSREIETILKEIQQGVQETISISTVSQDQVESHMNGFGLSLESLERIVNNVTEVDRMVSEIDGITREQTSATEDVLVNIKDLMSLSDQIKGAVTEQSQGIDQISNALRSLSEATMDNVREADQLKQLAQNIDLGE